MTGTCRISPARPLTQSLEVTHPGGENHELANNLTNHELAITFVFVLLPGEMFTSKEYSYGLRTNTVVTMHIQILIFI